MGYESVKSLVNQQLSCVSDPDSKLTRAYYLLRFQGFVNYDDNKKFTKEDYLTLCEKLEEGESTTLRDTDSLDQGVINNSFVQVKKIDGICMPIFYIHTN